MEVTNHELWTLIHGMVLGTVFLLGFGGGLVELYTLRAGRITPHGVVERTRRLKAGMVTMTVMVWLAVITGTWIAYPWYRSTTSASPKSALLADPSTAGWHEFGMEWKEHIAWVSPILMTVVAFGVLYYGDYLVHRRGLRNVLITIFALAFLTAGVAGLMGALITKAAPIH